MIDVSCRATGARAGPGDLRTLSGAHIGTLTVCQNARPMPRAVLKAISSPPTLFFDIILLCTSVWLVR